MIYYYNKRCGAANTVIKIETDSLKMIVYVARWFPNTQAKLNRLLNIMKDYDDDNLMNEIDAYISDVIEEELHDRL